MTSEHVISQYNTPKNINNLPGVIRNYYNTGLNKMYVELIKLQGVYDTNPFPVPVINDNIIDGEYTAAFSEYQDLADLGKYYIYYDKNGNLYKKSGIFIKSYKPISKDEFKEFLMKTLEDDDFGEEWIDNPNYSKISSLENKMKNIINKL